jgi:hypothetical protein
VGEGWLERVLAWIASVVALGLLGAGVYAVFYSTNGSGTFALLTIGSLALFVIVFRDRIRSMEFGGAKIQLALRVKNSIKRAFKLRLSGDYEQAEMEIELAFDQFVTRERHKVRQAYNESKEYQHKVLSVLGEYVEEKFNGRVLEASSSVSFLPLIDAVMTVDGDRLKAELSSHERTLCEYLTERLEKDKMLRAAVIVRPGPDLDTMKLVDRLEREVRYGALAIDCFLLVQNCKDSDSRKQFCELINHRGMHAKSLTWLPARGSERLKDAFLQAILTICDPSQCHFSQIASLTEFNPASQTSAATN